MRGSPARDLVEAYYVGSECQMRLVRRPRILNLVWPLVQDGC
jgi:hypothetical protein